MPHAQRGVIRTSGCGWIAAGVWPLPYLRLYFQRTEYSLLTAILRLFYAYFYAYFTVGYGYFTGGCG